MKIVLFSIFGFNIYSHGVFLTLAIVAGGWLYYRLLTKENQDTSKFLSNYIIAVFSGVILARIAFLFININFFSFSSSYRIWEGGLVSFAGFIGGAAVFLTLLHLQKQKLPIWIDLAGLVFPLAIAIGRIGCILNGEVGIKYYGSFAYHNRFPITAFEMYLVMFIFAVNFFLYIYARKYILKYFLILNFIMLYSLGRIGIDSYRADKNLIIGINLSQLTSFIIFAIAFFIFGIYYAKRKVKQNGQIR